jgi:hypothetical protein
VNTNAFIRAAALILTTAINVGTPAFAQHPLKCFQMHGHVAPDAGHPTYRVNPETRFGLIPLQERDAHGKFFDPLPPNVRRLFPRDQRAVETVVTGDFTICPLEPPRPSKLQLARMVEVKNLSVRNKDWLETDR